MEQETSVTVRWGEWIGEGWQMFADKWPVWVGQMSIVFLAFTISAMPLFLTIFAAIVHTSQTGEPFELPETFLPLGFVMMIVGTLGGSFLLSGLHRTAFKQLRGEPIRVRDLFSGGDVFLRVAGALAVVTLLTVLGFSLCILPAFVVAGMLHFTAPLIVERKLSIGEAISASYNATKSDWPMFVLFVFVLGLLAGLGGYACYIGLVASYPLYFTITAIAYRDIFGVAGARSFRKQQKATTSYAEAPWPPGTVPPPPQFVTPQETEQTLTICANCGTAISRAARFCNKCGNPLDAAH
ncbi:MAG: zinc-ribbon domain-containing protein [Acidobacteriota bacterium]